MIPATPYIIDPVYAAPEIPAVRAASSATGISDVPPVHTATHPARLGTADTVPAIRAVSSYSISEIPDSARDTDPGWLVPITLSSPLIKTAVDRPHSFHCLPWRCVSRSLPEPASKTSVVIDLGAADIFIRKFLQLLSRLPRWKASSLHFRSNNLYVSICSTLFFIFRYYIAPDTTCKDIRGKKRHVNPDSIPIHSTYGMRIIMEASKVLLYHLRTTAEIQTPPKLLRKTAIKAAVENINFDRR